MNSSLHNDEKGNAKNILNDLNYLTGKIPQNASQLHYEIFEILPSHIKKLLPNANVNILADSDVHDGSILKYHNVNTSVPVYDVLILGHQEYVTQEEYSNFKKFVLDGGILMILTGNVFYAEVKYDKDSDLVTLVEGHDWKFDGRAVHSGVSERWENETKQWLGSNFYPVYYGEEGYHILYNNPFNFTGVDGGEEQYYDKSNPNIELILDYNSSDPRYPVAAYELNYGKGKSIVIGLAAEDIISDPCLEACHKFMIFFDRLISNHVIPFARHNEYIDPE